MLSTVLPVSSSTDRCESHVRARRGQFFTLGLPSSRATRTVIWKAQAFSLAIVHDQHVATYQSLLRVTCSIRRSLFGRVHLAEVSNTGGIHVHASTYRLKERCVKVAMKVISMSTPRWLHQLLACARSAVFAASNSAAFLGIMPLLQEFWQPHLHSGTSPVHIRTRVIPAVARILRRGPGGMHTP